MRKRVWRCEEWLYGYEAVRNGLLGCEERLRVSFSVRIEL